MNSAKIGKLIRMANQIGDFFAALPEAEAAAGAANHLKRFWTPKMIAEVTDAADKGPPGLNATALAAIRKLDGEESS